MEATANNVAVINQQKDLEHLNKLVEEIETIKESYKGLEIDGPEDKAGYELVRAAIGVLRPKRTGLEAERKSVVKPYNDTVKFINGEYEKITSLLQDGPGGELELKAKKEAVDEIIQKQKEEEERQAEKKVNARINELIAAGMVFDGSWWVIGDNDLGISFTTVGIADIRTMSDVQYANTLELVTEKSKKIEAEKKRLADIAAKEKADKEAADKKEREEFEAQKKLMEEQQAEMKRQQDELKAQQDKLEEGKLEAAKKLREIEEKQRIERLQEEEKRWRGRLLQMNDIGFNGQFAFVRGGNEDESVITYEQLISFTDEQFNLVKDKFNKEEAERQDKKRIEEQQKKDLEIKAVWEKAEQLEKERLAGLTDKQRMQQYIDALYNVPVMEMTTKTWKNKVAMVRDFIIDNRPE